MSLYWPRTGQRIGTPKEDAFRRDLTINALFYNINTGKVEDHTGRVRITLFTIVLLVAN